MKKKKPEMIGIIQTRDNRVRFGRIRCFGQFIRFELNVIRLDMEYYEHLDYLNCMGTLFTIHIQSNHARYGKNR